MRHSTSGFTLIELSIVLVIIALIVGGVLVGQDLIRASQVRAQLTQIERYNSAANTFKTKYGGDLPGDMIYTDASNFGFPVGTGCVGGQGQRDGNGYLDGWGGVHYLAQYAGGDNVILAGFKRRQSDQPAVSQ